MKYAIAAFACLTAAASSAVADRCDDAPAVCELNAGKAALASDPAEAAKQLYASYQLDPKPATLAVYAYALHRAHRYAESFEAFTRAKTAFEAIVAATARTVDGAKAAQDPAALSRAQREFVDAQNTLQNIESELGLLRSLTAEVRVRYAAGAPPAGLLIARRGAGDVVDPFGHPFIIDTPADTLIVTYPDGQSREIALALAGGATQTVVIPAPDVPSVAAPANPAPTNPAPAPREIEPTHHTARWAGLALLVVGASAASVAGIVAYDAHEDRCPDGMCESMASAVAAADAKSREQLAAGVAIGGGVLALTGLVLAITDPGHSTGPGGVAANFNVIVRSNGAMAFFQRSF